MRANPEKPHKQLHNHSPASFEATFTEGLAPGAPWMGEAVGNTAYSLLFCDLAFSDICGQ
jgi:hypothetical protein